MIPFSLFVIIIIIINIIAIKKDFFLGLFLFFLSLYIIMPLFGYIFFPEISELMNAHFGDEILDKVYFFVIASFFSIAFVFLYLKKFSKFRVLFISLKNLDGIKWLGLYILLFYFLYLFIIFYIFYSDLNYSNINNTYFRGNTAVSFFITCYKFFPGILIVLYDQFVQKKYRILFPVFFCLFLNITIKIGFKTDLVALLIGLMIYNFVKNKNYFSSIKFYYQISFFIILLTISQFVRYQSEESQKLNNSLIISLIDKDYFPPAHLLFASIYYKIIDPVEVLRSNILNLIPGLKYPYLQLYITEKFNPGVTDRSSSYAYYVLSEGYNFMGMWGFIYNSLIGIYLFIYRYVFVFKNKSLNYCLIAILGMNLVNLVRGQSVYFLKYLLIMDFFPILLLLFLNGFIIQLKK